jgi:hypothetical protein
LSQFVSWSLFVRGQIITSTITFFIWCIHFCLNCSDTAWLFRLNSSQENNKKRESNFLANSCWFLFYPSHKDLVQKLFIHIWGEGSIKRLRGVIRYSLCYFFDPKCYFGNILTRIEMFALFNWVYSISTAGTITRIFVFLYNLLVI